MVSEGFIPPSQWNQMRQAIEEIVREQIGYANKLNTHLPASVAQFLYKSSDGDYIVCRAFDGTETGVDVAVAKPYLLRPSMTTRGVFTYTYTSDVERQSTDTGDSSTEDQIVTPSYLTDEVIYAARVRRGTGVVTDGVVGEQANAEPILWLDLNVDGRMWAEVSA